MSGPRVFQAAAMTAVLSREGRSLFVGATELELYRSFRLQSDRDGAMLVEVAYEPSQDPEEQLRIEEEQRLLVAAGWLSRIA